MPCATCGARPDLRIVLDTNVVLSALLWRGTPYRLLQVARQSPEITLLTSQMLLEELIDVLTRPFSAKRLTLIAQSAKQVLADYAESVELVTPSTTPRVIVSDPDDDHVIAAAVSGGADIIVSGDRHLLMLRTHHHVSIFSPADALATLVP